jgi:hypothetical protein
MMKNLLNVFGILILSMCALSCSKDNDDVTPVTKEEIVRAWTMSEAAINIPVPSGISGDNQTKFQKFSDTLRYLFKTGDKYLFKEGTSCEVSRNNKTAQHPNTYAVNGDYLTFDGYIKFRTNLSSGKLILTAGNDEIRGIANVELPKQGFSKEQIDTILKFISGELKLILIKDE